VRINLALCTTFVTSGGLASTAVSDILEGARELCQKIGDDARLFEVLENLSFQFSGQFELAKARALGNELLRIALRTQNPEMVGRARFDLGRTSMWLGDFVAARKEFDQASELPIEGMLKEETSFGNWQVRNRSLASLTLWISGFPDRAMVTVREAFLIASEKRASPADLIFALYWSAVLNLRLGDPLASSRQSNEAIRLIQERGLMSFLELAGFWRGWALAESGQIEEGLAEMQRSRMGFATAAGLIRPLIFEGLATVYLANGHRSEGLKEVNEALELIERRKMTVKTGSPPDQDEQQPLRARAFAGIAVWALVMVFLTLGGSPVAKSNSMFWEIILWTFVTSWTIWLLLLLRRLVPRKERPSL